MFLSGKLGLTFKRFELGVAILKLMLFFGLEPFVKMENYKEGVECYGEDAHPEAQRVNARV